MAADVGKVTAALNGRPGDNVVELLIRDAGMIVGMGVQAWLASLGIEPGFWSRHEFD